MEPEREVKPEASGSGMDAVHERGEKHNKENLSVDATANDIIIPDCDP